LQIQTAMRKPRSIRALSLDRQRTMLIGALLWPVLFGASMVFPPAVAQAEGDAAAGAKVFLTCAMCHSLDPEARKIGPNLRSVVGRRIGSVMGYDYSKSLARAALQKSSKPLPRDRMLGYDYTMCRCRSFYLRRILLVSIVVATGGVAEAAASEMFTKQRVDLQAQDGSAKIGDVAPGTSVQVLAEHGATIEIEVEGWSVKGAPSLVFAEIGQRILQARLAAVGQSHRTVVKQAEDDDGYTWEQVRVTGNMNATSLVPDVASVWNSARQIFSQRCSSCHALHRPEEFTANHWASIIRTMAFRAALSDDQADLIAKYLQTHAKGS